MKLLAIAFALLVAAAPVLPWRNYSTVPVMQILPACGGEASIVLINDEWQAISSRTRDIFLHLADGKADYGLLAVTEGDNIKVVKVLPFAELQKLYPDPCVYVVVPDAKA
jgi:hypothetical protein